MKHNFYKESNPVSVTRQLIQGLGVKVNYHTLRDLLEDHPQKDSLLSITDALSDLEIESECYQVQPAICDPAHLQYPFIAHIPFENKFALVKAYQEPYFIIGNETQKDFLISKTEFFQKWNGVSLIGYALTTSGEKHYLQNKIGQLIKSFRVPFLTLFLLIVLFYFQASKPASDGIKALTLLNFTGMLLSVVLLAKSFNLSSAIYDKFCDISSLSNCSSVIDSSASMITPWLSWSEIGLVYFSGSFIALTVFPNSAPLLSYISFLSLPFSLYLLGYQMIKKQWCLFCCIAQGLIIASLSTNLFYNVFKIRITPESYTDLFVSFSSPVLLWSFLKGTFIAAGQLPAIKYYLSKFKQDGDLFNSYLHTQARYSTAEGMNPLIFGNQDSENTITLVTNPFCQSCSKMHQSIFEGLHLKKNLKIEIVFATSEKNKQAKIVAGHITALYHQSPSIAAEALDEWYHDAGRNYSGWSDKYPVVTSDSDIGQIDRQKLWCESEKLYFTPAVFVNGYKFPDRYSISDLKYLLN